MQTKRLHIVAFDIPFPANYGGAIDVFYRLKALSELGVKITLHCFEYWRPKAPELEKYCAQVFYYERKRSFINQLYLTPYAVISRKNSRLIDNLTSDDAPILFEGLVCCYYMDDPRLASRRKLFRECNVEHDYYHGLAAATTSLRKRLYYSLEACKMERYEHVLDNADLIMALSHTDEAHFKRSFPTKKVIYLPCFHANEEMTSKLGKGHYLLYHGNLSLAENEHAAIYLCHNVFAKLPFRCVIAGLNPTQKIYDAAGLYDNIEIIDSPNEAYMNQLVTEAHINLLITFQATGMKLKLLNTLFSGRYIVANNEMLSGSGLETLCHLANSADKQVQVCRNLMQQPFTEADIEMRRLILYPQFDNRTQAAYLIQEL